MVYLIDKPGAAQSSFRLGSVGTRLSDTATTYSAGEQTAVDNVKAAEQ